MPDSNTLPDTPPRHLHIVRDGESEYDPAPRRSLGWTVMTPRETGLAILAELGPGAFAVYWVLESHADRTGRCWPSYDTIATQANVSRRQTIRHVAALATGGWIKRERRTSNAGDADANSYQIPRGSDKGGDISSPPVVTSVHQGGDTSAPEELTTEPEPKEEKEDLVRSQFEEFYRRYPRHEARKRAESAWRNLTAKKRAAALAALDTYRFSPDPKYVPLPASWLNAERWNDEQAAPARSTDLGPEPDYRTDPKGWVAHQAAKANRTRV